MAAILFAIKLLMIGGVPIHYGVAVYQAADSHQVQPDALGALLVSEHRGNYPSHKVSSSGAVGLLQIAPMWVGWANKEHGTDWLVDDLTNPMVSIELAAMIVSYSQHRVIVKRCGHHWVAHYKCSRNGRDNCKAPVARYNRIFARVQKWPDN
jgi:hypothetical protein